MSGRYSTYSKLKIDYPHQRVLRITFDRPETYNSVDAETHTELTHIWRDINEDPDIGAVIVTGAGKAFSAGGDFEMIKQIIASPAARMTTWKEAKDLVYNVINCNKPIISAINGVEKLPKARRVVLVGNKISPGNPVKKPDGTVVRTLWGELAWQLGFAAGGVSEAKKAFARVAADDEKATSPGDTLRELMNAYGAVPSLFSSTNGWPTRATAS